jgi:hypothetical protein
MDVSLKREVLDKLSHRGIMAYVAVVMAGEIEATTAAMAARVRVATPLMRDGLQELADAFPLLVGRAKKKGLWWCGEYKPGDAVVQILDSPNRYRMFVDDLQKYWNWVNAENNIPFAMGAKDGAAIRGFLTDNQTWGPEHWRTALNHRSKSVVSKTAPFYTWVRKLGEYAAEPLNEFNKPQEGTGKHGQATTTEQSNRAAREASKRTGTKG